MHPPPLQMYHASRESFLYLRDFYLGEIHPEDRAIVPQVRGSVLLQLI
jgi:hypothetical protein